ncbi:MAG TPA: PadR family transcriptional regulator [Longimicrobiales bacterium]|jgi:DNA-binding PadR family transcriptional regulator
MSTGVLGGFEHQVLLAMLRLGSEAYSVPVVMELEGRTGQGVSPSKVYVTLRRLEDRGLVSSRFVPPPADEGGRERRVFALEAAGLEALRESKRVFVGLWEDLAVLDEP